MRKITVEQARAARAYLDWSIKELAEKSGVSVNAISRFENGTVEAQLETLLRLQYAFERAGISFPDEFAISGRRTIKKMKATKTG